MLAATALAHGHGIATRDTKSFPGIAGLKVDAWSLVVAGSDRAVCTVDRPLVTNAHLS
jgi:hypothetical protein